MLRKVIIFLLFSLYFGLVSPAYAQTTSVTGGEYLLAIEATIRVADTASNALKANLQKLAPTFSLNFKVDNATIPTQKASAVVPANVTPAPGSVAGKDLYTYRIVARVSGNIRAGTLYLVDEENSIYASKQIAWNFTPGNYTIKGMFIYLSAEQVAMANESIETRTGLPAWAESLTGLLNVTTAAPVASTTTVVSRGNPLIFAVLALVFLGLATLVVVHGIQIGLFKPKARHLVVANAPEELPVVALREEPVESKEEEEVPLLGDLMVMEESTDSSMPVLETNPNAEEFSFGSSNLNLYGATALAPSQPTLFSPTSPTFSADGGEVKIQAPDRQRGNKAVISKMGLLGSNLELGAYELLRENAVTWLKADRVDLNKQSSLLSLARQVGLDLSGGSYTAHESAYMNNGASVDFVLEVHKAGQPIRVIAIEMDGRQHETDPKQKKRDKRKDAILKKMGIWLIRAKKEKELEGALTAIAPKLWKK
jgi:hypothetical protein